MSNYRKWLPNRDKVVVSSDVTCQGENICGSQPVAAEIDSVPDDVTVTATVDEPAHVNREEQPQYNFRDRQTLQKPPRLTCLAEAVALLAKCAEPISYTEARSLAEAEKWKKAMDIEMDAHIKNSTWELIELLADRKAISFK